jgi:hypothetical protein
MGFLSEDRSSKDKALAMADAITAYNFLLQKPEYKCDKKEFRALVKSLGRFVSMCDVLVNISTFYMEGNEVGLLNENLDIEPKPRVRHDYSGLRNPMPYRPIFRGNREESL